jgi:hypothetical protein
MRASVDDLAQLVGTRLRATPRLPARRPKAEAILVLDQGLVVAGDDAEALAMVAEKAARAVVAGEVLGGVKPIPAWEASLMRLAYKKSYAKQAARAKITTPALED